MDVAGKLTPQRDESVVVACHELLHSNNLDLGRCGLGGEFLRLDPHCFSQPPSVCLGRRTQSHKHQDVFSPPLWGLSVVVEFPLG